MKEPLKDVAFKGLLSFLILHELKTKQLCGEDLAKRIGKRKGATLTPGTIYPTLKDLRRRKYLSYTKKGRKKIYRLRPEGEAQLDHMYDQFAQYFWGLKHIISKKRLKKE